MPDKNELGFKVLLDTHEFDAQATRFQDTMSEIFLMARNSSKKTNAAAADFAAAYYRVLEKVSADAVRLAHSTARELETATKEQNDLLLRTAADAEEKKRQASLANTEKWRAEQLEKLTKEQQERLRIAQETNSKLLAVEESMLVAWREQKSRELATSLAQITQSADMALRLEIDATRRRYAEISKVEMAEVRRLNKNTQARKSATPEEKVAAKLAVETKKKELHDALLLEIEHLRLVANTRKNAARERARTEQSEINATAKAALQAAKKGYDDLSAQARADAEKKIADKKTSNDKMNAYDRAESDKRVADEKRKNAALAAEQKRANAEEKARKAQADADLALAEKKKSAEILAEQEKTSKKSHAIHINWGSKLKSAISDIAKFTMSILAASAIKSLVKDIQELSKQALPLEVIGTSFRSLGGDIAALREGTLGLMSDVDIMKDYNMATQLVGNSFSKQLPEILQQLTKVAASTGQSMDYMFESIVRGIARLSPRFLDNLGVMIKLDDAYEVYASQVNKSVESLTAEEKQTAVLNETLKQLDENLKDVPGIAGTAYQQITAFNISLKNTALEIGNSFIPIWLEATGAASALFEVVKPMLFDFIDVFKRRAIPVIQDFSAHLQRLLIEGVPPIEAIRQALEIVIPSKLFEQLDKLYQFIKNINPETIKFTAALGVIAVAIMGIMNPINLVLPVIGLLIVAFEKLSDAQREAAKESENFSENLAASGYSYDDYLRKVQEHNVLLLRRLGLRLDSEKAIQYLIQKGLAVDEAEFRILNHTYAASMEFSIAMQRERHANGAAMEYEASAGKEFVSTYDDMSEAMLKHIEITQEVADAIIESDGRVKLSKADLVAIEVAQVQTAEEHKEKMLEIEEDYQKDLVEAENEFGRKRSDAQVEFNAKYKSLMESGKVEEANLLQLKYRQQAEKDSVEYKRQQLELKVSNLQKKIEQTKAYMEELAEAKDHGIRLAMERVKQQMNEDNADQAFYADQLNQLAAQGSLKLRLENAAYLASSGLASAAEKNFSKQTVYMYKSRLTGQVQYQNQVLTLAQQLAEDLYFVGTATGPEAIGFAYEQALANMQAELAAALAALGGSTYNPVAFDNYAEAATGAGESAGESATRALASIVDDVNKAVTDALDAIEKLVGFDVPAGVDIGLGNLANFIKIAVDSMYATLNELKPKVAAIKDTIGPINDLFSMIKTSLDAEEKLAQYEAATNLDVLATQLANNIKLIAGVFNTIFTASQDTMKKEDLAKANAWWNSVAIFTNYIGSGIDALNKLAEYKSGNNIYARVSLLCGDIINIARAFSFAFDKYEAELSGGEANKAKAWWDSVSVFVKYISDGINAISALSEYKYAANIYDKSRALCQDIVKIAKAFSSVFTEWESWIGTDAANDAAIWVKAISGLVGGIKDGMDTLKSLDEYTYTAKAYDNARMLAQDMTRAAAGLRSVFLEWGEEGDWVSTDSASTAAPWVKAISELVGNIKGGIDALESLSDYKYTAKAYSNARMLAQDMTRAAAGLRSVFLEWGKEDGWISADSANAAAPWVKAISELVSNIKGGIDALESLTKYKTSTKIYSNARALGQDMTKAAAGLRDVFSEWGKEDGWISTNSADTAASWYKSISELVGFIKDGVEAISALSEYKRVKNLTIKVHNLAADMIVIATTLEGMFNTWNNTIKFEEEDDPAIVWWNNIESLIGVVKPGIEAIAGLTEYKKVAGLTNKVSNLAADMRTIADTLNQMFLDWGDDIKIDENALTWWNKVSELIDIIKPGIDAISAIADFTETKDLVAKMDAFESSIKVIIKRLVRIISADGMPSMHEAKRSARYFGYVQEMVAAITPACEAINRLVGVGGMADSNLPKGATLLDIVKTRFAIFSENVKYLVGAMAGLSKDVKELGIGKATKFKEHMEELLAAFEAGVGTLSGVRNLGMGNAPHDVIGVMKQFILDLGKCLQDAIDEVREKLVHIEDSFADRTEGAYAAAYSYGYRLGSGVRDGFYAGLGTLEVALPPTTQPRGMRGFGATSQTINLGGIVFNGNANSVDDVQRLGDVVVQRVMHELRR